MINQSNNWLHFNGDGSEDWTEAKGQVTLEGSRLTSTM